MIKRFAFLALLALAACAPPETAEDAMVLEEPAIEAAPMPARGAALPEECSGDGIGGTGCPEM